MDGNGFCSYCPDCGTRLLMTTPANDWGCHLLCSQCGYSISLEEEAAEEPKEVRKETAIPVIAQIS